LGPWATRWVAASLRGKAFAALLEVDMRRTVQDVMTRGVVVARPETTFKELAWLLHEHRIGAVPVLDALGWVVGVVSESDLALKEMERDGVERGEELLKAVGASAAEVMTTPAVTVRPDVPVAVAARLMHDRGVKHLPVVDWSGVLVGIVARADLLKVFLRADEELRFEILDRLAGDLLHLPAGSVSVDVQDGAVTLRGSVARRAQALALQELAAAVDGVVGVDSRLVWEHNDVAGSATAHSPDSERW
jgi:CBS domain-containing protein